ncbi:MAG TPA: caspase family protein [Gemmataceae bacterium]|nr:caspase family protein [Gemmataceae bacterium]
MSRRFVPSFLAVLFLAPVPLYADEAKPSGDKYAFLVGCGHYSAGLIRDLSCTAEDVNDFAAVLRQSGWTDDHIVVMHDRGPVRFQPEKKKILKELQVQLSSLKADDFALVALSGHGMRLRDDDHGYFCPADAQPDDKDSLLSLADVYDLLSACPARRKFLVVNACRCDGAPGSGFLGLENLVTKREDVPKGVAVLFSCAAGQPSWGDEHLGHSVFFHYLMQGWEGDANPKGAVTLDDLVGYVRRQTKEYVRTKMNADQAPAFTGQGVGAWVLSDNGWTADAEAKAVAVVERLGGTVTRDEERPGKPVVEVHLGFSKASDADLKELAGLTRLQVLALPSTAVSDAGMKRLATLPSLRKLYLNDTGVTDAGMKDLLPLHSLQALYLGDTKVSDAGLKQLAGLKGLQELKVHSTAVTAAGVKELQAALPGLSIDY